MSACSKMHDCVSIDTVLKYSVRGQLSGLRQTPIRDLKPVNIYLFHPFEVIRQSRLMASQAGQGLADRVSGGLHSKQCGPNQCPNLCLWTRLTPKTTGLGPGDFGLLGRFRENWQQTVNLALPLGRRQLATDVNRYCRTSRGRGHFDCTL